MTEKQTFEAIEIYLNHPTVGGFASRIRKHRSFKRWSMLQINDLYNRLARRFFVFSVNN